MLEVCRPVILPHNSLSQSLTFWWPGDPPVRDTDPGVKCWYLHNTLSVNLCSNKLCVYWHLSNYIELSRFKKELRHCYIRNTSSGSIPCSEYCPRRFYSPLSTLTSTIFLLVSFLCLTLPFPYPHSSHFLLYIHVSLGLPFFLTPITYSWIDGLAFFPLAYSLCDLTILISLI